MLSGVDGEAWSMESGRVECWERSLESGVWRMESEPWRVENRESSSCVYYILCRLSRV